MTPRRSSFSRLQSATSTRPHSKTTWRGSEGAGLYFRDWTPRPAALAYQGLVTNQWWTRAQGTTGTTGQVATRGFLGDYTVTVSGGGKTQTALYKLSQDAPELVVTLD